MATSSELGYRPESSRMRVQDMADVDGDMAPNNNDGLVFDSAQSRWVATTVPDPNDRNNFSATSDPTTGDDEADGYQPGSIWINTTSDDAFICVDATEGAAVWKDLNADPESNFGASAAPTVNDDSGDGYSPGSVWVDTTNSNAYICLDASTGAAVWGLVTGKVSSNLGASAAPTVNDDSGDGYSPGSFWVNTASDLAYICVDASSGAAVWKQVTHGTPKANYIATTNPGVGDDSADGYAVGSLWLNTTLGTLHMCTNASTGAAVWAELNPVPYGFFALQNSSTGMIVPGYTTLASFRTPDWIVGDASDFNSSTGIYTVPEAGYYYIFVSVRLTISSASATDVVDIGVHKNNNSTRYSGVWRSESFTGFGGSTNSAAVFECSAGDTLYATMESNTVVASSLQAQTWLMVNRFA